MPKLNHRLPKMCRDRNQAFSWHKRKRICHGRLDSPEADQSYKRFITTLLENPALPLRDAKTGEVLVSELVRPDTVAALREVRSLPKGEPGTFDNPPREDVPLDVVRQTLPFMPPVLRTMVMLQLQTGCDRPKSTA